MNQPATCVLALAATMHLSACGGGGGTTGDAQRTGPGAPSADSDLAPDHVAAVLSEDGTVRLAHWAELSASGEEPGDDPPDDDAATVRLNRHVAVVAIETASPLRSRGWFVSGDPAPHDALGGTATYEGVAATLEFHGPVDADDRWNRTAMSAENGRLVADFDAATIAGQFDEWRNASGERDESGEHPVLDASITFEPAPITRTGFRGDISVAGTAADLAGTWSVSYEGSFYGPGAGDVAGVMRGTRQAAAGGADQVIGWFATAGPLTIDLNGE